MESLNSARTIMTDADAACIDRLVYELAYQILVQLGITIDEVIFQKDGQEVFRWPVAWPDALQPELVEARPPSEAKPGRRGDSFDS
jgi:hypothetical protein